jgi:hypothetical protein
MNTLRIAMVASLLLIMTSVEASSYSSSRHIRKPGHSRAKSAHAPAAAHGDQARNGPMVVARPQPHVQTLPATMLSRSSTGGAASPAASPAEPKLTTAQENELRWRLYSYP